MCCRPLRSFLLALACLAIFASCAVLVTRETMVVRWDRSITAVAFRFGEDNPSVATAFTRITDLGAGSTLWYVGGVSTALLVARREFLRAVVWVVAMLWSRPVSPWLKAEFSRTRPEHVWASADSFPSGHAFGSAIVYGMLALAILIAFREQRWRWVVAGVAWAWIVLVAISRLILGVHFPTDVIAGTALGLGWGLAFTGLVDTWEWARWRWTNRSTDQLSQVET